MFKKLTLLILMVISLDIYSQVVIKDEIILEENDNPDEEYFTMPFYGKVKGDVYTGSILNGHFQGVKIYANGQTKVIECPCGQGCVWIYPSWQIVDLPQCTSITVNVFEHCVGGQPVEAETRFYWDSITEKFYIEYYDTEFLDWYPATTLWFDDTTPPGCDNAQNQYCTEHGLEVPSVKSKPVEWSNGDPEFCYDYPGTPYRKLIPMAFTNFKKEWLGNFNVFACFDKERQKWQFLLDNNNTLNINNFVKICEDNLSYILELNVVDSLDQVPNSYPCDKLIADLKRFKSYGDTKPGSYVFRKLIYQHEMLHINEFQEKLVKMQEKVYNNKYKDLVDIFECEDFDDPEDAAEEIKEIIEDEWIDDLRNHAWGVMSTTSLQLLDLDEEVKRWLVHKAESFLHQKMLDIIDAWIAEAQKCLE
ncbi:MAG: hypothetical protein HXY50_17500 [Ignavibacteriaceae bacterium]|nr:hypothetical protein [Ignavibacteriaceae bacterium]